MGSIVSVQKVAAKRIGISYDEYLLKIISEKWCTKCKSWQRKTSFNIDKSRGDGLTAKCHNCVRVNRPHKSHKGRVSTFKGKNHTEETKRILSEQRKGNKSPMEGKKHSLEVRKKISEILRKRGAKGDKCHSYKDGKSVQRAKNRLTSEYKRWRFDVYARDNFTCQKCGDDKGGNLIAHHIKPYCEYPELRLDINNGITLCNICHDKIHYNPDSIRNKRRLTSWANNTK